MYHFRPCGCKAQKLAIQLRTCRPNSLLLFGFAANDLRTRISFHAALYGNAGFNLVAMRCSPCQKADYFDMNPHTLDYDSSYHCYCSVSLNCGRKITLQSLSQDMTYGGVLMGVPNSAVNDRILQDEVERASKDFAHHPFLIPPERRDFFRVPGDMQQLQRNNWIPEWMPVITCIGKFESGPLKKGMDSSLLEIIWFQDDYAMPISRRAMNFIRSIDWASHAFDYTN